MSTQQDVISTLNNLIDTSKNGEMGFHAAAELAKSADLKVLLEDYSRECARAAHELQECVRSAGGPPDQSGTMAGAAHRSWMNLKAMAASNDDKAVLEECERGEDHAKAVYAKALKAELPPQIREVVQRQFDGTVRHHDRIRELRDSYSAAA
jgi:uncharacterized protein (TIGR02284 family)